MAFAAFTSSSEKKHVVVKSSRLAIWLLLPGLMYLAFFFLTPLISLVVTSLSTLDVTSVDASVTYGFNPESYVYVTTTYFAQIIRSFGYALAATIFALLISYPLAYFIGVKVRNHPLIQKLLLTMVIAPFFISFLLRTIAWKQLLADDSMPVQIMHTLGILAEGQSFIGTDAAVIFGLTYNFIPFMTLPLYTTLERLDVRLLEASGDLYASPTATFFKVTLPLSMPGVISGTLLTFIPIAGDYVNASRDFLGSSKTSMIGNMVEADFLQNLDYPAASALSVVLMAVILVLISVYVKRTGTEDLL